LYNEQGQLIAEHSSSGAVQKEYIYLHGQVIAMIKGNQLYNVHNDHLGRAERITHQNQSTVWRANNSAFNRSVVTDTIGGYNLGFPGQYWDEEKQSYYNYFRDYDPKTGRYIQSDPIGLAGGVNTYGYVGGNPVNYFDSFGLLEWNGTIEGASATVVFGAGFYNIHLTSECVNGQSSTVQITAVGPALGVGGKFNVGGSEITVNDMHDYINPNTFNGFFSYVSGGVNVGLGYSFYMIQIGGTGLITSPTGAYGRGHGLGGGWGYGLTGNPGSATVHSVTTCSCK